MWVPNKAKLVKVCLHSQGEDVETPWAEDLGEVPGRPGARFVRLGNVPLLHAKPTYGDVIVVEPDPTYKKLTWNSAGVPFERIGERITEDGGRYTMVVDYRLLPATADAAAAFKALDEASEKSDIAVEGVRAPKDERAGRAYLAVPSEKSVETVLAYLRGQRLSMSLRLVHSLSSWWRRLVNLGWGFVVVALLVVLTFGTWKGVISSAEAVRRPVPGLALFGFALLVIIFAVYGLDAFFTGLNHTHVRRFSRAPSGWVSNVLLWAVLGLLFFSFYSLFSAYGRAR